MLNEKQAAELQKEIESKYIDSATELFSKEKDDIRNNLYTYENPLAQKNVNGVDLRVAEGRIEVDKNTGEKRKTYLLYADGKIAGKFYSVKDIKDVVKIIEDNLVKSLPSKTIEGLEDVTYIEEYEDASELARKVKDGDIGAIRQMAQEMASKIPKNATIIPMSGRKGVSENMLLVANEISKINGNKVADIIIGEKRESLYDLKKQGKDISQIDLGLKLKGKVPEGEIYVIDNVVGTGKTVSEIRKLLPKSKILVHSVDKKALKKALGAKESLPTEKTLITSEKAKGLLSKFKKVEETPAEETKTEIKIVEDEAENGIINEKLTEKDNLEQEPSIKAIESKAANTSRATEAELEKVSAEIDSKIGEATDVKTVSLESLNTDEARFQNRAELNDAIVNDIAKNWRDANQDPIHVWTDPKDGKTYVLSGHHRYYGAKRAGRNVVKIIDRSNDYTEAEAIKFAKEEANANRSMETPLERANALRAKRERGDSKEDINTFLDREGKGKTFINNLSFLNPFGKTMQMLKSLTAAEDRKTQKEAEQVSDWVGEARRLMPDLTDAHESEMYDFLMDADASQRITKKADFVQKVRSALNNFDITEPLNLRRFKYKTLGEEQYDREVYEKKALIEERQNQINELNERFSNPSSPNYISTESPNFSEARKIANDKIATLDAERKILQKQLEEIYRNKGRYTGGPSTGTLFSVEKNRTAAEAEMTDAVEEIIKDNPEASETEVVAFVSQEVGDNSNAFRTMVTNSYAEAKNRQTEQIVRNPIIRRINKAFLGIKTVILENAEQLREMASKVSGARYNVEEKPFFHGGRLDSEGDIFLTKNEEIAKEYASINKGEVKSFSLDENKIMKEDEVRKIINELGLENKEGETNFEDLLLHELLDPRFETSFSKKDIDKIKAEVKKRGYDAISYIDEDITGKSKSGTESILVFNNEALGISEAPKQTSTQESAGFTTRDGKKIGFVFDTDKVARERFDFSKLEQIGQGSDRVVFDLGDGKVLKVAKTARGLEQNIYEGEPYLGHILPEVYERGLNYVVVESTPRLRSSDIVPTYDVETGVENGMTTAGQMIKDLSKFNQRDFDQRKPELQDVLAKYGFSDILSYEVLYGDFNALRNWGYKNGMPMHLDGGTFGGVRMIQEFRGKKNLEDADFRNIYYESKKLKKEYADKDKYTMFHYK